MKLTHQELRTQPCSRDDAFTILAEVRPRVVAAGYELALYGSVLRDGMGNDLDLFAVPTERRTNHEDYLINALRGYMDGPYQVTDAARGRRNLRVFVRFALPGRFSGEECPSRLLDIIIIPDPR